MGAMAKVGSQLALLFTGLLVCGWWLLAMQETGWATKVTAIYKVEAGLIRVSIKKGLVSVPFTGSGSTIAKYFKPTVETTAEFQDFCCGFSASVPMFGQVCGVGSVLHSTSVAMLLCILFGTIFMCIGAGLLAMWQYDRARENLRHWMQFFYGTAPLIFAAGTVQYMFFSALISELPDLAIESRPVYGPCALISIMMSIFSMVPFIVCMVYVEKTAEEALNEHLSLMHKDAREQGKLQNYLAAAGYQEEGRPANPASESYGQQAQQAFQPQPSQYNSNSVWGPTFAPAAPAGPGHYRAAPQIVIQAPAPAVAPSYTGRPAW